MYEELKRADPETYAIMKAELARQREGAELIPSENIVSLPVLQAMGSLFTNKYAEGYPGKRYYGGNEEVDKVEVLAVERAKELFGAEHVNVQPYSGSPANQAIYMALLEPGDKIMGLKLDHGGHLTHGHPVNFSGKLYDVVAYEVDEKTELLDYDKIEALAKQEKPKAILAGYTAYPRDIDYERFRAIADSVGAYLICDVSHTAGLIAGKQLNNPVPYADAVMTTTHKTLRGPRGAMIMCKQEHAKAIDKAVFPGLQGGPHEHAIAAKAVAFKEALTPEFQEYAAQVIKNAKVLAETLAAGGVRLVGGGTDTHLILLDVTSLGLNGKQGQNALEAAGIYANKNTIPYDKEKPFIGSGVRIGTPVLTTRGMKEPEMKALASLILRALKAHDDEAALAAIKEEVLALCEPFPIYPELEL